MYNFFLLLLFVEFTKIHRFDLSDEKKIRHAKEVKTKEELRRRLGRAEVSRSFSAKSGAMHSASLKPTRLASTSRTRAATNEIEMPLLESRG